VRRLALVSALIVLSVAAALASPAGGRSLADPPAELFVFPFDNTPGTAAETDVDLSLPDSSSLAMAAVTDYLPTGYAVGLSSPPGTAIGQVTIFVSGQLDPISAGLFTADPAPFATDTAAQACAPGAHAGVWTAALTVSGAALQLTILVDPTTGDEAARGAFRLVYCLPSPSVAPDQGGLPGGARVVDVDLDLQNVLTNAAGGGVLTWRAFVTPYQPGTGTPLPAGAFEVRSIVALPQILSLRRVFAAKTNVLTLSGRLVSASAPRSGINIHFAVASKADLSDARDLGVIQTQADGSYAFRKKVARKKTVQRLILIAYVNFYVRDCTDAPLLAGGCSEESIAPPPARFAAVTIPKQLPKH
jgi:hypothetical protein